MLFLERAHGCGQGAETLPANIFFHSYNTKSISLSKTFMFLKKGMCGDVAGQHFLLLLSNKISVTLKNLFVVEVINGIIAKTCIFHFNNTFLRSLGPLESPELREPPKSSSQRPRGILFGVSCWYRFLAGVVFLDSHGDRSWIPGQPLGRSGQLWPGLDSSWTG